MNNMTEEAKRKIDAMYKLFGHCKDVNARCIECRHLQKFTVNRTWYKCRCYGTSSSEATDWRCSWSACGLFNSTYNGKPVIDVKKNTGRKKAEEQIEGQMSLF